MKEMPATDFTSCQSIGHDRDILELARNTALKLLKYCEANNWAGYDPYDALNSRVFRALPFLDSKITRLMLTQGVKRCPINLRPLLLVAKTPNSKGIALFLSSLTKLAKIGYVKGEKEIGTMAGKLMALRSPGTRYVSWGYNFDWQTRSKLVPKGSPNIICSTFAANSLLDAYEQSRESLWLDAALSSADFLLDVLFRKENNSTAYFSYTPLEATKIHNANLLGAAFLCRIAWVSGSKKFLEPALDAARYSLSRQHEDGSWAYGESSHQEWIDNFHTGYNLVALRRIKEYGGTSEFDAAIRQGFEFYRDHFFRADGAPKYFHNSTYPIDIHCAAQSMITLVEFKESVEGCTDLALRVFRWAMANMWDARGFFYFQQSKHHTVRIPFMRWSQAWMLLALATLLGSSH